MILLDNPDWKQLCRKGKTQRKGKKGKGEREGRKIMLEVRGGKNVSGGGITGCLSWTLTEK